MVVNAPASAVPNAFRVVVVKPNSWTEVKPPTWVVVKVAASVEPNALRPVVVRPAS